MDWLDDSLACLNDANQLINEIKILASKPVQDKTVVPYLKTKIKNCLENCRSPLDYAANYIFNTYCKSEYEPSELQRKKTYFPIKNDEYKFNKCMKNDFKSLSQKRQDIVNILKKYQPFKNDQWLQHLTILTNENKHRNLSKQTKQQMSHIVHAQIGNSIFKNITMVTNDNTIPIKLGDTAIDFTNHTKYDHLFDVSVRFEYIFSDLNLPVIQTLINIHTNTISLINDLKVAFEET